MSRRDEMLNMLTSAYNNSPTSNLGKLLTILGWLLDGVTKALNDTRSWRDIQQAAGVPLNHGGANYGAVRGSADDDLYRLMIIVKAMARVSPGDGDTLIRATAILLQIDEADIQYEEGGAEARLIVDDLAVPPAFFTRADVIGELLQSVAAGGVLLVLELQQPAYQQAYIGIALQDIENVTIRQVN